jgi:hypothetical protein
MRPGDVGLVKSSKVRYNPVTLMLLPQGVEVTA